MADPSDQPVPIDDTAAEGPPPRTPRWVKVSGAIALVLVLLLVALLLVGGGNHGPGRHAGGGGDEPPAASGGDGKPRAERHRPPAGGHAP